MKLKASILYILIFLFLLEPCTVGAQSAMEFVENKGQWDKATLFRGGMINGALELRKNGYRILLHHPDDLRKLSDAVHGHAHANPVQPAKPIKDDKYRLPDPKDQPMNIDKMSLRSHMYEMRLLNANESAKVVPDKSLYTYNNYFIGEDPSKWASNCRIFQTITYENIYPKTDVRYYSDNGSLKYDFILHPGADVKKIVLYFNGVESLRVKDGNLVIKTSVGEVKELSPYTYQLINGKRQQLNTRYEVKGNLVQFVILDPYKTNETIVIDPQFVFSTFTGSTADNWGYTATYDSRGNFYAGGIVFSAGFPVNTGAFQTNFAGGIPDGAISNGYDMAIIKFSPDGARREYATYIGGNGNEQPHSLVADGQGNLVIAGRSNSANYPKFPANNTLGAGGGWDIVLTKLNAAGSALMGSVEIGGRSDDGVNIRPKYSNPQGAESIVRNYGDDARSEVILDVAGNVYMAGCTQSRDFPTTSGVFQPNPGTAGGPGGRYQDGVLIKMAADLRTPMGISYIGGSNDDAAFVLSLHPQNGNIYIGGATASTDLPGVSSGAINASYRGGICDGFVMVVRNDLTARVTGTYLGTNGADLVYGLKFDRRGFPYVMGTTTGSWPVLNAAFSQTNGKQFIAKLREDLSAFEYSTIFGTNSTVPNISPTAFLVDRCENVYVSGWGGGINRDANYPTAGTSGLTVVGSLNGSSASTDGSDLYFFVLAKNATSQLYGDFFGQIGGFGEHVDGGTSRFDENGVIYQALCANCGQRPKPTFPTGPSGGVFAEQNLSGDYCNLAAVKIALNLAGVGAGLQSTIAGQVRDTSGCVPLTVEFSDTLALGKQYVWNFGDGSPDVTTTVPRISYTFNAPGNYRVRLIAIDRTTCNETDTSYLTMRVRNDEAVLRPFDYVKADPTNCTSLEYRFTNNSIAPIGKPFPANAFRWVFGDGNSVVAGAGTVNHTFAAPGSYNVRLVLTDTTYCNAPDSIVQTIRITDTVRAEFTVPNPLCAPQNVIFDNVSRGGQSFLWTFHDATTSTDVNPTKFYSTPGSYTVTLRAIDPSTCNRQHDTTITIVLNGTATAAFTFAPLTPIPNRPVSFTNTSTNGAIRYKWLFGDGDVLETLRRDTIVEHYYPSSGKYQACLVAINAAGCADTTCQEVSALVDPLVDVPNAFSPNGDGVNDKIQIRGFGMSRVNWRIYNRWGKLVFVTNDPNIGWDGTFNGQLQPQEVYHYVLEVEFTNKAKVVKKGDITLLR